MRASSSSTAVKSKTSGAGRCFSVMLSSFRNHTHRETLGVTQICKPISALCAEVIIQMYGGMDSAMTGGTDRSSARRLHKADREKLRRDKLNEQFLELASALDPDRPKNDKATILGESVQVVKDLREEVKRLKTEHTSLLHESRDLTQEKSELREEKASLKNETEQLQSQLQQRLRTSQPWMTLDPMVMGGASFPYPLPVPQPLSLPQSDSQVGPPRPLMSPAPYMPIAPTLGPFHMHPSIPAYAMFGNRHGEGGNSYLPYPAFPQPVNSQSHIERPYAQYPSPVQPVPGYVVQMSPSQIPQLSPPTSSTPPVYTPCVPGIPLASPQNQDSSQRSKGSSHRSLASHSSSQDTLAESEQESVSVVGPDSNVEATQAHEQVQCPDVKGAIADLRQEDSSAAGADVSTNSVQSEEIPNLHVDQDDPNLVSKGSGNESTSIQRSLEVSKVSGNESASIQRSLEVEPEHIHDPTLRPPAA